MEFSIFGKRYSGKIGISELMDDLGNALAGDQPMLMLGGGNPSHIPAVQKIFRSRMEHILGKPGEFEGIVGDYDTPQGATLFIEALAELFQREFGWGVKAENIALTNGSQNSFFALFNMFAGTFSGNRRKRILLPLVPEYIGYADVGLEDDFFQTSRPGITRIEDQLFKYHIDFDSISVNDEIGAVCVSRPTNPTANVLTDEEVATLGRLAADADVPLIIDNAYGTPFPNMIYENVKPVWNRNTVVCMSLSKLGLPGLRTGIVIADKEIIRLVSRMNAVFSLAPGSMGAAVALDMVRSGEIIRISREFIRPYYERKARRAVSQLKQEMAGLPCAIHKPEGAPFLWLWFDRLPVSSCELYERLKARGVLVVSGHYFFPGLKDNDWRHRHECIRVTYAQDDTVVEKGLAVIADEIKKLYANQ